MTHIYSSTARYDDEVLRCWAHQASQLQAAHEALWRYLERPAPGSSSEEQP
ncbi:hypothetical protein ACUY1T_06570 [Billgrantia sp. Q4P2]|uniref:hypothetical protein n=1 Tax=Billgrantia sp. Q4P2 TaxID=3463857 RepID=UPI004055E2CA